MYVNHEIFRDMHSVRRKGGIEAAVGESRTVPRYFSCSQSRTVPMYIAFWQLHSHLYLEKSRVIWDSAGDANLGWAMEADALTTRSSHLTTYIHLNWTNTYLTHSCLNIFLSSLFMKAPAKVSFVVNRTNLNFQVCILFDYQNMRIFIFLVF